MATPTTIGIIKRAKATKMINVVMGDDICHKTDTKIVQLGKI